MPKITRRRSIRARLALPLLTAGLIGFTGHAAAVPTENAAASSPASNSEMDALLFYQLLVGELELRTGQAGVAYQVLLDAARRSKDEELFKRVINIALQARAGEQALGAAQAWRDALPASREAQQMTIQLLALLNRPADIEEPLRAVVAMAPADQRAGVLASLPRLFQRAAEPKRVYAALKPMLQRYTFQTETRAAAKITLARLALAAGEGTQALELAQELLKDAPEQEEAMQLALELMPKLPAAEALIAARLQAQPANHALRLAYGRTLARGQRAADAAREFRAVTVATPDNAMAWFGLGSLELELRHADAAEAALKEYLKLMETAETPADPDTSVITEARQQAWLMLAQAAELRGDMKAADAWLVKVDSPQRALEARFRRASLLARQGKLAEARQLLQTLPGHTPEAIRARLMAEAQLLREAQAWPQALEVLSQAAEKLPEDAEILYEQSMMAEKLGKLDQMEALLKRVISLKPDHYHAYNALGYSLADRNTRLQEARELIAKALSYAPSEPFIVDSMGWVEYRLGNNAEALRLLRQSYAARPDAEIAAHLGEVLWANGERDEARRIWAEGSKRDPQNDALRETQNRLKARP